MRRRTQSEELLALYLREACRRFVEEPLIGGVRPDFLVDGQVVCEVTSFIESHLPLRVGARDPLHPLRMKVQDKWKQAEAVLTHGHPFVLVLHQDGHQTDLGLDTLAAATFGDLSVPGTFDDQDGTLTAGSDLVFGGRGSTEVGNRNLSALAILRVFNPTLVNLLDAWKQSPLDGSVAANLEARSDHRGGVDGSRHL